MEQSKSLERTVQIITGDRRLTLQLMGLWQGARVGGARCRVCIHDA